MSSESVRAGSCLCGAVKFEVSVPKANFSICHCGMCRRWCGGPLQAVECEGEPRFTEDSGLTWYRSSDWAERGFCNRCGTSLFWRYIGEGPSFYSATVDSLEQTDDLTLDRHIYIDEKPARYDFKDDRPRVTEAELMKELGIAPPES